MMTNYIFVPGFEYKSKGPLHIDKIEVKCTDENTGQVITTYWDMDDSISHDTIIRNQGNRIGLTPRTSRTPIIAADAIYKTCYKGTFNDFITNKEDNIYTHTITVYEDKETSDLIRNNDESIKKGLFVIKVPESDIDHDFRFDFTFFSELSVSNNQNPAEVGKDYDNNPIYVEVGKMSLTYNALAYSELSSASFTTTSFMDLYFDITKKSEDFSWDIPVNAKVLTGSTNDLIVMPGDQWYYLRLYTYDIDTFKMVPIGENSFRDLFLTNSRNLFLRYSEYYGNSNGMSQLVFTNENLGFESTGYSEYFNFYSGFNSNLPPAFSGLSDSSTFIRPIKYTELSKTLNVSLTYNVTYLDTYTLPYLYTKKPIVKVRNNSGVPERLYLLILSKLENPTIENSLLLTDLPTGITQLVRGDWFEEGWRIRSTNGGFKTEYTVNKYIYDSSAGVLKSMVVINGITVPVVTGDAPNTQYEICLKLDSEGNTIWSKYYNSIFNKNKSVIGYLMYHLVNQIWYNTEPEDAHGDESWLHSTSSILNLRSVNHPAVFKLVFKDSILTLLELNIDLTKSNKLELNISLSSIRLPFFTSYNILTTWAQNLLFYLLLPHAYMVDIANSDITFPNKSDYSISPMVISNDAGYYKRRLYAINVNTTNLLVDPSVQSDYELVKSIQSSSTLKTPQLCYLNNASNQSLSCINTFCDEKRFICYTRGNEGKLTTNTVELQPDEYYVLKLTHYDKSVKYKITIGDVTYTDWDIDKLIVYNPTSMPKSIDFKVEQHQSRNYQDIISAIGLYKLVNENDSVINSLLFSSLDKYKRDIGQSTLGIVIDKNILDLVIMPAAFVYKEVVNFNTFSNEKQSDPLLRINPDEAQSVLEKYYNFTYLPKEAVYDIKGTYQLNTTDTCIKEHNVRLFDNTNLDITPIINLQVKSKIVYE